MEPVKNPYSSGPSAAPPILAGREDALSHARLLVGRLKEGRSEKGLLLTGLRGSGKTVLAQAIVQMAQAEGIALKAVDEAHSLSPGEIGALIKEQEENVRLQRPTAVLLAGLPFQEQLDDASHTLAARVFAGFELDKLGKEEATAALGAHFETDAAQDVVRLSKGHPGFLQAWAYEAWNAAKGPLITRADVRACAAAVTARLDRDLYGPGFDRLSPREKAYLRTMAHLGAGPHRSGDIADSMDAKITSLGPLRAKLLQKGWVYSPGRGMLGFTAPSFDEFMRRVMPGFR